MTTQTDGKRPFYRRIPGFRSGKPWKMLISSATYLVLFIIVLSALSGSDLDFITTTGPTGLEVTESRITSDMFTQYVVGKIKNNTSNEYSYVQVEINVYDAAGNQVGSTLDNCNNLEPGATWSFKAVILEDNVKTYKIKGITAY